MQSMKIKVTKPSAQELEKLDVKRWPTWSHGPGSFPWEYDCTETAYVLEGEITVTADGESVSFGAGDLVVFPKGLVCEWHIKKAIRKHYLFA